jgi:serine/threonine protein kinase/tetratricopeptide (TPR) repeat protein
MSERDLFIAALQISDPVQRSAWLDRECGGDAALRQRIEVLLQALDRAGSLLDNPVVVPQAIVGETGPGLPASNAGAEPSAEQPGAVIGPYKLIEQIGEGGMGAVWMAQQTEPVKRLVAVKLIKAGLDSKHVIARFEAERQALALMDHPHIARVLDAGTTAAGRPYFVMDLVKGAPITKYCDEHHLTPRQRLELFLPVCQAVQHAHQKGIIHRDLKPSNVLVALYDGRPVPKVIDFGVAKAAGQQLTDRTLVTGFGAIVGTLEYMSPEQAEVNQLDIDTRSDIYSLGVLLYELLVGSPPFTRKGLGKAGLLEMLRVIREEEPAKPSTKLSTAEGLPTLAANRGMEPAKLTRLVRGELDWIVMKALEKDRSRRYETANSFALDVQRYLADEPVLACPPSVSYRLRKFVRRNRGVVVTGFLVAIALLAGLVGTMVGLVQAEQAKDTAEKRLAQVEKGIDLLGSVFADLDPFAEEKEGRPLRAILGERLDQAAAALEGEGIGDPLVVARLQERLGQTYLGLGHAAPAEALFAKAVATRQALLGPDDPLTLGSMHHQAVALEAAGKRIEAIKRFEQVHAAREKVLGADHLDTLGTLNELAVEYWLAGRAAEAIPLLERVRDRREQQLGPDHDQTLATLAALSGAYTAAHRHAEAIALAEEAFNARVKKHGADHPHAVAALGRLAFAYQAGYRMKPALALFEQARDTIVPKLGPHHPLTLKILHNLAVMYRAYGRTADAIALLEPVREKRLMALGGHHPATILTLNELAMAWVGAGEPEAALPLFQQAAAGVERLAYAHDDAGRIVHHAADCHEQLQQYEQAEVWRRKWVAVAKERYGLESIEYASIWGLTGLGSNLLQQKRYADAEPILRESLAIHRKKEPEVWNTFHTQSLLGGALLGQQKYAEAEPDLVQGYQGMRKTLKSQGTRHYGPTPTQRLTEALERLVQLYDACGRPDEAATWRQELGEQKKITEKMPPPKPK